jgi:hypothetical protein
MLVGLTQQGAEHLTTAPAAVVIRTASSASAGNGTRTSKIVWRRIAKHLGSYTELRE